MKKTLLLIPFLLFTYYISFGASVKPQITLQRLDNIVAQPCDTVHNRLIIKNDSLRSTSFQDTITINYYDLFTGFEVTFHNKLCAILYSYGYARVIVDSFGVNDSFELDYKYYIPCSFIVDGSTLTSSFKEDAISIIRKYVNGIVVTTVNNNDDLRVNIGYANLYISPSVPNTYSHLSTFANIGETIDRSLVLESISSRGVDFDGYINITDSIINSCNLYVIDSIIVTRVNPSTTIPTRTVLYEIGYTPSRMPNMGYLLASHLHVFLEADEGEYLEVREVVRLIVDSANSCIENCSNNRIESNLRIDYGCDSTTLCKNTQTIAYIYRGTHRPNIEETIFSDVSSWDSACFRNPVFTSIPAPSEYISYKHVIKNTGTSTAFDINFRLRSSERTSEILLKSAVEARLNGVLLVSNGLTYYLSPPGRDSTVMPTCAKSFMQLAPSDTDMYSPLYNISWRLAEMKAGDSIEVNYKTYRCCPSDINKFVGSFSSTEYFDTWRINGYLDNVDNISQRYIGKDECGDELVFEIDTKEGILLADMDVNGIQGPAHLTGVNDTCHPDKTAYYQIPILSIFDGSTASRNEALLASIAGGTISGQLIVEVSTEHGLNPIPSSIRPMYIESSFATGSTLRFGYLDSSSYVSTGGMARILFDLDSLHASGVSSSYTRLIAFLTEGYLHLPITPCCNGLPTPSVEVKFYIVPNRGESGTCIACKIPIAKTSRKIFLHCPGCVTPGVIVDKCDVIRITTGYPDTNNNGLANSTTPYSSIDAITRNRFAGNYYIAGDEIRLNFEAYAQDGDDADTGYTYATLRDHWQTLHAIDVNHPTAFTHLYIYVNNPCADTNRFNWGVQTDTLKWIRGSLNGQILLNPYFVHGANKLMYRVPVSVLGDSISMSDIYKVAMTFKACGNSGASECEISTYMWWCADTTMDENAYTTYQVAGDINEAYQDSTDSLRIAQATPSRIYLCEASGDIINAYKLKREYNSTWENEADPDFPSSPSCNKKLITNYTIRAVDIDETKNNLFPYEYRPISMDFISDYFRLPSTIAPNYTLSSIRNNSLYPVWTSSSLLVNNRNTTLGTYTSTSTNGNYILPLGSALATDSPLPANPNTNFIHGDERNHIRITYDFVPATCATPGTAQHMPVNQNKGIVSYNYCVGDTTLDTFKESNSSGYIIRTPNPSLQVLQTSGPVTVYSTSSNCFRIRLKNNASTNQVANNVWLHAIRPNLGGVITSISEVGSSGGVDTTSIETDSAGGLIANINHLGKNQFIELEICFEINSCVVPNFIQLNYGFSCIDTLSCKTDSIRISLYPTQVDITHTPTSARTINTQQCKLDTIECAFRLRYPGDVDHIGIGIHVPTGVRVLGANAIYTIIGPPVGASDTLHIETTTDTTTATGRNIYYTFDDDTALHGTPTRARNEIEIHIAFIIGSCRDNDFKPIIYMRGQSFCNTTIQDSVTNITINPTATSCPNIILIADSIRNATCNGSRDGYLRLVDTSGSAGLGIVTYAWSSSTGLLADTGLYIDSLLAGTYTVTATDGYGCSATESFTINALTQPILLPTVSYQPYTTCDLRADSIVFAPYMPPVPSPLPLPYTPPIPHYTYTWTATNIDSLYPDSGVILGGTLYRHSFPIRFADSLVGSTIIIRATDSSGCYDELRIWVEPCCVRSERLISNIRLSQLDSSLFFRDTFGYYNFVSTSFRINGTFTIDRNCTFTAGDFYMEPYSQIIILPNLNVSITQKNIVACDTTMWKGIIVGRNSTLNVQNDCRIYDALTAIKTEPFAKYYILRTDFNRNWIDIDVGANMRVNNSTILASHLFSHNETIEYHGNTPPRSGGRCWAPHREEQSSIGIRVNLNRKIIIGVPSFEPDSTNTIEDKQYGVYSSESSVEVVNNVFNNIRKIYPAITIPRIPISAGDAIYFEALNDVPFSIKELNIHHNNIINTEHSGVYMTGALVQGKIFNNRIQSNESGVLGMNLLNTTSIYLPMLIANNHITHNGLGIGFNNIRKMNLAILADTIISNSSYDPMFARSYVGVRVGVMSGDGINTPMIRIINNRIYNGLNGIELQNVAFLPSSLPRNIISQNHIESSLTDRKYTGIYLNNSWNININNNFITGRSGVSGDRTSAIVDKKGIYLKDAPFNTVSCNTMDNMYKGFTWTGNCFMPNNLYSNIFNRLANHIYGSDTRGFIGDQEFAMIGTGAFRYSTNSMTFRADRYSIYNLGVVFNYYRKGFTPNYNPWSALRTSIAPIGVVPQNSTRLNYNCTAGGTGPSPLLASVDTSTWVSDSSYTVDELGELLMTTDTMYTDETKGLEYMNKEMLYDLLKTDSNFITNDSIEAYYIELQNSQTGLLDLIKQAMNDKDYALAQTLLAGMDNSNYVEEANNQFYELMYIIDKRATIESITIDTIDYEDTLAELSSIYTPKNYYQLDVSEIDQLLELASRCPIRYGQSVYGARVILNTQAGFETMNWDDEDICIEGINYRRSNESEEDLKELVENKNIEIYPNPTSSLIYYTTKQVELDKCNEIVGYQICNAGGRDIAKVKYEEIKKAGSIDVSTFAEGLYFIYFDCSDGTRVLFKFVINK
jgi:hypothetical protein